MHLREEMMSVLRYVPETGEFFWTAAVKRNIKVGAEAGRINSYGYRQIGYRGKRYLAHRLAWLFSYGKWPEKFVDHINGLKDDNRLDNLRAADIFENQFNSSPRKNSTSGYKGVSYAKATGKWQAQMEVRRKVIYLGQFETPEMAHDAYVRASKMHHGAFARN